MAVKYAHILEPIKVGNLVFKNRLISANSLPHFLQGPETYPAEPVINHMVDMAKNGAAVVTFSDYCLPDQRESPNEDGRRFPKFDLGKDPSVDNYMSQMADQVHYFNSYISLALMPFAAPDIRYDINDEPEVEAPIFGKVRFGEKTYDNYEQSVLWRGGKSAKALSRDQIHEIIEQQAQRAKVYQTLGFDMVTLHFAYRATLFSRFLSPKTNQRTDEYGGSLENRARFMIELAARIKELCGRNFPIEVQITADEEVEGGTTLDETIRLAKLVERVVDIFQFRASTANLNHPTGYNSKPHKYNVLDYCAAVKASGTSILCEPVGGFQDADDMEAILAEGKADLIGGARLFLCDFDYYDKIKEGRGEDVTPCIRCNKCHVPSMSGPWLSFCSVNPRLGLEHRLDKLTRPVSKSRNLAIVGGGPAGMRAAVFARERGYAVTLFEKSDRLGGQLNLMDFSSFKWPLVRYREWLIGQVEKNGTKICLNHAPSREELEQGGYDVLLLALGAVPVTPPLPGADQAYNIFTVFGSEAKMGRRCVVIGGSESGTEAGLYLAENGHQVTILTRGKELAPDANFPHFRETIDEYYQQMKEISYLAEVTTTKIGNGYVIYKDREGAEHRIECDDVVALGGMRSLSEEAFEYYDIIPETIMIGDCFEVGNLHTGAREAFSAVYNL